MNVDYIPVLHRCIYKAPVYGPFPRTPHRIPLFSSCNILTVPWKVLDAPIVRLLSVKAILCDGLDQGTRPPF